jgi:hypothetical protein
LKKTISTTFCIYRFYCAHDRCEFGSNSINLIEETGGNLFDQWIVHPRNSNSAAVFSAILGEVIREAGCKAGVVVDGYINITDLLAVVSHFGMKANEEDINNDGIVDTQDLLLVIGGWGDCWPVQAPLNTTTLRSH